MLEVDVEDHEDLFSILKNVEKKDVPDDMLLFWEEQKKNFGNTKQHTLQIAS